MLLLTASFDVDRLSPSMCGVYFVSVAISSGTWCSSIVRSSFVCEKLNADVSSIGDMGRESAKSEFEPLGIGKSMVCRMTFCVVAFGFYLNRAPI